MKILVTGGAGFIGSHICTRLVELGYSVVCIDNLSAGKYENISHLVDYSTKSKFRWYQMDINEITPNVLKAFQIDAICHQAAIGSVPKSVLYPEIYQENNINGFFNVLNAAKEVGIKRFVYASSSSVYGSDLTLPKIESSTGKALSPYAATKQINEVQANTYHTVYGMETIGLRYFNVFGPKQNPDGDYAAVIPKFIKMLMNSEVPVINGDGSYSRDFTYIDNVVQANVLALTNDNISEFGKAVNIGAGQRTSIMELYNLILNELDLNTLPQKGPFRKGDIPNSFADISLATQYLGYQPTVNIKEGLTKTIQYFNENINNSASA